MMEDRLSSEQLCRDNGWGIGTQLTGDEGWGETTIELTHFYLGAVFAKRISYQGTLIVGEPPRRWTLLAREWSVVKVERFLDQDEQIRTLTSERDALQAKVDVSVILTTQAVADMRHIIKMGWGDDLCDYLSRALGDSE